jgi:hypothetical protein
MNKKMKSMCGLVIAAIASGAALAANAADVRVGLSTRETYVGLPVTLRIQVSDAAKAEAPVVRSIDGVEFRPFLSMWTELRNALGRSSLSPRRAKRAT